jgi:zinc transporter ZupT
VFDALVEGVAAVQGSEAFEGPLVVFLGVLLAYVVLEGVEGFVRRRQGATGSTALSAGALSLLIAIGIGLHNFGEGLAIGSAYAVGALALGAFLVVGFAIHNTTEGLAIVTPLAEQRPRLGRLALLGLIAGGPAIIGAIIGSTAYQPALAAFLLGVGAGAIAQVAVKLLPLLRDRDGRTLDGLTASALTGGVAFMFATSLLISA